MHPFFQIGCFSTFFEEKGKKMHQNFELLGAVWKKNMIKNNFPTDRLKYSEIPLEGITAIFFFLALSYLWIFS